MNNLTKDLSLNLTKTLTLFLVAFLLLIFTNIIYAQPASPTSNGTTNSTSQDLTYPIIDLGSCKNLEDCTNFCNDPINYNNCSEYAKQNGFYKDDPTVYGDTKFWDDTNKELGCGSTSACLDFCSKDDNHDTCESYAKRHDILGGYVKQPDKKEILETAKQDLGCDSKENCSAFCADPNNQDKCNEFANKTGLLGGKETGGPGGCQTPETCGSFCSDPNNFKACQSFSPGNDFRGPGGCTDVTSCRNYCESNPDQCRSYAPDSSGYYVPFVCPSNEFHGPGGACTAVSETKPATDCVGADKYWNGDSCQDQAPDGIDPTVPNAHFEARADMGNCKTPGECYDYCKANPTAESCKGFDGNSQRPTDDYTPYVYFTPGTEVKHEPIKEMGDCTTPGGCYDYCKDHKDACPGFNEKAPRPPDIYIPGTYYTPPHNIEYVTPPVTNFYTTPLYYTPPAGSNYTTPNYYTPGTYSTPSYYTPPAGSNYTTPNYYTPWNNYPTPTGAYPTPTYSTPSYYTPPAGSNYTTPYYYTPPQYMTPYYYTPPAGSTYTTPSYTTPPTYTTPQYYTP
ncbi:hypothetical protein HYW46_03725 [Candidatus Daviesbacteria bacterium]|nr:hypothetical protein [Candidatus Daviesbacteria bacterium]